MWQLFIAWDAPHPWLWVHSSPGSTVFKDSLGWWWGGDGANTGPYLSHAVISHSPSETHYKKALVFKNTLHVEISYTHIYPHAYIWTHIFTCTHTALTHKCSYSPFFCIEIPFPSLDPAQSHHLGEDLIKFLKTKNTRRQMMNGQCMSVSSSGLGQRLPTSLLQLFFPPLLAHPGTKEITEHKISTE